MPELSRIHINEDGDMFMTVPMPPFNDQVYVMIGYDKDGAFQYRLWEDEDRWTE